MSANVVDDALALISAILDAQRRLEPINDGLRSLFGDFHPHQPVMPETVFSALEKLLNDALGDGEMATYFLWECQRGGGAVHETDGTVWPIRTVDDLRAYVTRPAPED